MTKMWTATLIMQLAENALLDPDTPVTRYIPEFRVGNIADNGASAMTVRHLLTHMSGICDEWTSFSPVCRGWKPNAKSPAG
ncbi:serine hydrolase [Mycolicibacterium wolinskyi]|uniref:serine hydrolase n=1 Tax=Mycolicibacterium wolinskyi TaxID=59750 RepID=UPI0021F2EDC3|nr:serine hydrolase domain-containing protein [Mycolicibacterium wolinskyi]